ncbi:MAG: thioredoxin family protein [Sphingobacteriia bacterium]|nr:thioredoxin family protein [Sphingobacteriia bacterium]
MKKHKLLNISIIVMALLAFAFVQKTSITNITGINFIEQDWDKALNTAKLQKKLVFVDVYATWCGPCKMLKRKAFADKKIADFFNENFVNVSVDAEKGVGLQLANKYAVSAYPTLLFTDASGNPVLYSVGYMNESELMAFAKAALKKTEKK